MKKSTSYIVIELVLVALAVWIWALPLRCFWTVGQHQNIQVQAVTSSNELPITPTDSYQQLTETRPVAPLENQDDPLPTATLDSSTANSETVPAADKTLATDDLLLGCVTPRFLLGNQYLFWGGVGLAVAGVVSLLLLVVRLIQFGWRKVHKARS